MFIKEDLVILSVRKYVVVFERINKDHQIIEMVDQTVSEFLETEIGIVIGETAVLLSERDQIGYVSAVFTVSDFQLPVQLIDGIQRIIGIPDTVLGPVKLFPGMNERNASGHQNKA